jgi:hypothetical protein
MKQTVQIMVGFDKPTLLKDMVEKLVTDQDSSNMLPEGLLQTASTEAYVFGTVTLEENRETISLAFDGSFLFTCIKSANTGFELTWSSSLS